MMTSERLPIAWICATTRYGPAQRRRAGPHQIDEEGRVVAEDAQQLERAPAEPGDEHRHFGFAERAAQARTPKSSASGRAG